MKTANDRTRKPNCITIIIGLALSLAFPTLRADDSGCLMGAIRWDAWVGALNYPTFSDGVWNQDALGPAKYHDRLPFYAEILGQNTVTACFQESGVHNQPTPWVDQAIMDEEIKAASGALDYWAFMDYPDPSPTNSNLWPMHTHLALYLASPVKNLMHFAMITTWDSHWWDPTVQPTYLAYLADSAYQKVVINNVSRPLFFLYNPASWWCYPEAPATEDEKWAVVRQRLIDFTNASIAQGSGVPYFVCMGGASAMSVAADKLADPSTYGTPALTQYFGTDASYLGTGKQLIPCAKTGWDGSPRVDLWNNPNPPHPNADGSGHEGSSSWSYGARSERLGPKDLAARLKTNLIDYVSAHSASCESRTTLVYAWNEFSEGGWLCPTFYDGDDRLRAMRAMRHTRADYRLNGNGTDLSSAQASLTLANGAGFADGRNGPGLVVNGVNQYAWALDNPTFDTGLSQLSVICWIKLNSLPPSGGYVYPLAKDQSYRIVVGSSGSAHFAVATTNNAWYSSGTKVDFGTLSPNVWYQLAATYDGTRIRTYLNGVLASTGSPISGAIRDTTTSFCLGSVNSSSGFFNGTIDEVSIWKTALPDEQIGILYNDGYIAGDWPLNAPDEYAVSGYPQYFHDASRNTNDATPQGGYSAALDYNSKSGGALALNGTNAYASVPDSPTLKGMGQLSVACWVRLNSLPPSGGYVFPLAKDLSYRIAVGSSGSAHFAVATSNNAWYSSGTMVGFGTLSPNNWYHLVATYDGTRIRTYLNGALVASGSPISGTIKDTTANLTLGTSNGGYLNGSLDEVTIFNKALSDQEVLTLYNNE